MCTPAPVLPIAPPQFSPPKQPISQSIATAITEHSIPPLNLSKMTEPLSMDNSLPAAASLLSLRHSRPLEERRSFWATVLSEYTPPPEEEPMKIACMLCGVRFRKSGHLNMHWRHVHSSSSPPPAVLSKSCITTPTRQCGKGGRSYGCPQCDAWFKRGSDRNRHMRMVHAKIRPFQCAVCGNCFGRKSFLQAHVLTVHEKARPFRCGECGAAFGQRSSLTRHCRKIHGKEP